MAENTRKDVAQAQFAKLQRATDAKHAMAEYESEAVAMRAKTARLRGLRLARDAEQAAARGPRYERRPDRPRHPDLLEGEVERDR